MSNVQGGQKQDQGWGHILDQQAALWTCPCLGMSTAHVVWAGCRRLNRKGGAGDDLRGRVPEVEQKGRCRR
eukprot:320828-Chlamydomonas_euryale.AAC.2